MIQIKTSVLAMNDRGAAGMGPTPGQKLLTACVLPLSALHKGLVVFIIYGITLLQLDINYYIFGGFKIPSYLNGR
jgi:hypothetical protein